MPTVRERIVEKNTDSDEGDDGGHCSWTDEISVSSIKGAFGSPQASLAPEELEVQCTTAGLPFFTLHN